MWDRNKKIPRSDVIGLRSVPIEKGQWWKIRLISKIEKVGWKKHNNLAQIIIMQHYVFSGTNRHLY